LHYFDDAFNRHYSPYQSRRGKVGPVLGLAVTCFEECFPLALTRPNGIRHGLERRRMIKGPALGLPLLVQDADMDEIFDARST